MRNLGWALAIASTTMLAGAAVAAGQSNDPTVETIDVSKRETITNWSNRVTEDLGTKLKYPRPFKQDYHQGVVKVQFVPTAAGTPTNVAIVESSNKADLDRAALKAVAQLDTLSPMPSTLRADRPVQMWIYFARTALDEQEMVRALDAERHGPRSELASNEPYVLTATAQ
ncbi:energy transducer TonB [Sphingomonas naphthae]|uniref:Energy transducer TonB n=1 Tax=Sphingomonas naphthae TaxID=1813468 RepID=A0ABY7TPS8_9SPHN|nr:energy transducer TonB [Sphingomonas naphthae]WCT75244.1 energy transducer TonB [Sphingomonas naphthae]